MPAIKTPKVRSLPVSALRPQFDAILPAFERSDELPLRDDALAGIAQDRAREALEFGLAMRRPGYNIFVMGPTGAGKKTLARRTLSPIANERETPQDWCYVHNFAESDAPVALALPAGRGSGLQKDMERFVEELEEAISSAFETEDYRLQKQAIDDEHKEQREKALDHIKAKAGEHNLTVLRSSMGFAIAPLHNGEVLTPVEFEKLEEEERKRIKEVLASVEDELEQELREFSTWEEKHRDQLHELNGEVADAAVKRLIAPLCESYSDLQQVVDHLDEVRKDIVNKVRVLVSRRERDSEGGDDDSLSPNRYLVNLLVDNGQTQGAPVVFEDHPTLANIIGHVDHKQEMGALYTDYRLVKGGAMHRANGGYLLLDTAKLLEQPAAYEALKRAMRGGELRIESVSESIGLGATVSLRPKKIPVDLKVILFGDRRLYYLLHAHDPDFRDLFKVAVDIDDEVTSAPENVRRFAFFLAEFCKDKKVRPMDRPAILRTLRVASRISNDQERLSCHSESMGNILYEADHWAQKEDSELITLAHIEAALAAQDRRSGRISNIMREQILRDTILLDSDGNKVGQINALSVMQIGDSHFGKPSRITARVRVGQGNIVDIEREVDLGGSLHTKGVLILSGFLGARYAQQTPLALSASLVFEQSYGGVDGDSASSTELYALLSAIAEVPLRQDLAVTGSVNQFGEIQPIGGVNEKIEGFFEVCRARGLTGSQGVLIPISNVKHLVLNDEVIQAVQDQQFHIYPVKHIDEGIELLTEMPAGRPERGVFPEGSFNAIVEKRLRRFAKAARRWSRPASDRKIAKRSGDKE